MPLASVVGWVVDWSCVIAHLGLKDGLTTRPQNLSDCQPGETNPSQPPCRRCVPRCGLHADWQHGAHYRPLLPRIPTGPTEEVLWPIGAQADARQCRVAPNCVCCRGLESFPQPNNPERSFANVACTGEGRGTSARKKPQQFRSKELIGLRSGDPWTRDSLMTLLGL